MAAVVLQDLRIGKLLRELAGDPARHDPVRSADEVQRRQSIARRVVVELGQPGVGRRKAADHHGEVEAERLGRRGLSVRRPQADEKACQRRALAEPEHAVERPERGEDADDLIACSLPAHVVLGPAADPRVFVGGDLRIGAGVPPAEVARGQRWRIDADELGQRVEPAHQRGHLAAQRGGAAVIAVKTQDSQPTHGFFLLRRGRFS